MSMPGQMMLGDRRAGWDLSSEDPDLEERYRSITAPLDRAADPEGGRSLPDERVDQEQYETRQRDDDDDDEDTDEQEERRARNREYSRAGQERRQYRDSLQRIGQDLDKEGNVVVVNPAVYRGYLEAQGLLPNPQQQREAPKEEQRQARPGPQAPAAVEIPPLDDPNDPMPDPFETEELQRWVQRSQQRAVAHATALSRQEAQQREFEIRQQQHQQQEELDARFGQMLSPMEQAAGFHALQAAQRVLPGLGMGALLQVPDFQERMHEALRGGKVPLQQWTDPQTLQTLAGVMIANDPQLFQAVIADAAAQQAGQQRGRGNAPPDPNSVRVPSANQQYYTPPPRNPGTMADAARGGYGAWGATNGGRQEQPQYAPEILEYARRTGKTPEEAAVLSNPNLSPEEWKAFQDQQAARSRRGGGGR